MRFQVKALIILVSILSSWAEGDQLAFTHNPRTQIDQGSTLISKSVAHACLGLLDLSDGLECNPANSPYLINSSFGIEGSISNGYSNLQNVRDMLSGNVSQDTVNNIFGQGRFTQIDTSATVLFKSKYFSGSYTPLSVRGFSIVRNEANPEAQVQFVEETGFAFQSGAKIGDQFSVGLQTRLVSRKSVSRTFKLVELATESGRDLLKPQDQTVVFLEPGATWIIAKAWQPRISVFVQDVPISKNGESYVPITTSPQAGFAISPPVKFGQMDLMLEYRQLEADAGIKRSVHLGGIYRFGSMNLLGGIDGNGSSGGVFYTLDKINAGIMYSTTTTLFSTDNFYTQTVYAQLGWQL